METFWCLVFIHESFNLITWHFNSKHISGGMQTLMGIMILLAKAHWAGACHDAMLSPGKTVFRHSGLTISHWREVANHLFIEGPWDKFETTSVSHWLLEMHSSACLRTPAKVFETDKSQSLNVGFQHQACYRYSPSICFNPVMERL